MAQTLKHRTLSSAILDQLRQEILDGVHPAGMALRQDFLAEHYAVSRIPVREALFQLEAEGLVHIEPHKGAVVTEISNREVRDVFELRALLEPRLLHSAVAAMTDADFERLEAMESEFERAMKAGDVARWGVLNAEFHLALYRPAELPRTNQIVAGLLQTSDRYTRLQLSRARALERAGREHRMLVALCRKGKVDEACRLLGEHIGGVQEDLEKVLAAKRPRAK